MGLDVTVYKNIKRTNSDEDYDFTAFVIDPTWEHKIKNLEKGAKYEGEVSGGNVSYAYSSHSRFREHLLKLQDRHDLLKKDGTVDWERLDKFPELPFYELINFADNEGCLDWETNEKLYNDFKACEGKAVKYAENEHYFIEHYKSWLNVFENGKQRDAVVVFH